MATVRLRKEEMKSFDRGILRIKRKLAPDVVEIMYDFDEDWTGAPALFFRVVLSNEASHKDRLLEASERASRVIRDFVERAEIDQHAYFYFRSEREWRTTKDWRK